MDGYLTASIVTAAIGWLILRGGVRRNRRFLQDETWRRCQKCRYDMTRTPGLTCGECGHVAPSEGHLSRVRGHLLVPLLGVLMCFAAPGVSRGDAFRATGWPIFLPTTPLVVMAPEIERFAVPLGGNGRWAVSWRREPLTWLATRLARERVRRTKRDQLFDWQWAILLHRTVASAERAFWEHATHPTFGTDIEPETPRGQFNRVARVASQTIASAGRAGEMSTATTDRLDALVTATVTPPAEVVRGERCVIVVHVSHWSGQVVHVDGFGTSQDWAHSTGLAYREYGWRERRVMPQELGRRLEFTIDGAIDESVERLVGTIRVSVELRLDDPDVRGPRRTVVEVPVDIPVRDPRPGEMTVEPPLPGSIPYP